MSSLDKLADLFKERENPVQINITIGEVLSTDPISIQFGPEVVLRKKHLYVSHSLYTSNKLSAGDKVMMIPDNALKFWYVIDKAVKL